MIYSIFNALRSGFKAHRGSIFLHKPLFSIDSMVTELLIKEFRFKSHVRNKLLHLPSQSILVIQQVHPSLPLPYYKIDNVINNDKCFHPLALPWILVMENGRLLFKVVQVIVFL